MCLLAPHSCDALEDDTAHERNTHSKAGEGERGIHTHLDATGIQRHSEDGKDRTDGEASNTRTVKSGLGGGLVRVHVEVLSLVLLSTTNILNESSPFVYMNCHHHKSSTPMLEI